MLAINFNYVSDILLLLVIFLLILFFAYYASKWIGNYAGKNSKDKNIEVLEVFRLNQTKCIYLTRIGDKIVALGVSKEHIEYITEIPKESFIKKEEGASVEQSFIEILKEQKDRLLSREK